MKLETLCLKIAEGLVKIVCAEFRRTVHVAGEHQEKQRLPMLTGHCGLAMLFVSSVEACWLCGCFFVLPL